MREGVRLRGREEKEGERKGFMESMKAMLDSEGNCKTQVGGW